MVAGQQGFALAAFLLVSVPARAQCFVLLVLLAHAIARRLPDRLGLPILASCRLVFYTAYFTHLGW